MKCRIIFGDHKNLKQNTIDVFENSIDGRIPAGPPFIYDAQLDMRPGLLFKNENNAVTGWKYDNLDTKRSFTPLGTDCQIVPFHSNALIDINGDCIPDVVLSCDSGGSIELRYYKLNVASHTYERGNSLLTGLPIGTSITYADINADGHVDLLYIQDNQLHVLLNKETPYCESRNGVNCKPLTKVCFSTDKQSFDPNPSKVSTINFNYCKDHWVIPIENPIVQTTIDNTFDVPVSIAVGDIDLDGYPDILIVTQGKGKPFVSLYKNVKTKLELLTRYEAISSVKNVMFASFYDVDNDVRTKNVT
jgi:integrin alpha FG-GAP repeat containing protein 1